MYSLPGEIAMNEFNVEIKSGKDIYNISIPTINCSCSDNFIAKSLIINQDLNDYGSLDIKTYPNPSTGLVTFEINNPVDSDIRIEIISLSGVVIYTNVFQSQAVIEQINLGSFPRGMYIVHISSEEFTDSRKLFLKTK